MSELETARARIAVLEALCADAYQLAGTVGAPVRFLDALAAAADGKPIPKGDLLPVLEDECEAVGQREALLAKARSVLGVSAAAELGRVGGAKTSSAKRRAARANGKKGGRPKRALNVPFHLGGVPNPGKKKSMKIEY